MTTKVLSATTLALLVGIGAPAIDKATAQNGGEARSNDRALQKTLDDKHLTPIRPIRRVGPDTWPAAKDPRPTNLPPETTGQSANGNEDESSKQDGAKRTTAQQDTAKQETKPQQRSQDRQQAQQPAAHGGKQQDTARSERPNDDRDNNQAAEQGNDQDRDKGFASIRLGTDKDGRVAVNDAQERQIARALRKHDIRTVDVDVKIGAVAPADVRLGAVSADVVAVLPQFRGYSFFATRDRLVIVEPDSNKVVALVPVKLTATASKSREKRTTSRETTATHKPARKERDVTVGRRVPSEAEILAAPVVTAPAGTVVTRGYRTYRVEEPAETVIIERRRPRLFGLW